MQRTSKLFIPYNIFVMLINLGITLKIGIWFFHMVNNIFIKVLFIVYIGLGVFLQVITCIHWCFLKYSVTSTKITIFSGVFLKKEKVIPFNRIKDVHISRPITYRILRASRLTIDIGATSDLNNFEFKMLNRIKADEILDKFNHFRRIPEEKSKRVIFSVDMKNVYKSSLVSLNLILFIPFILGISDEINEYTFGLIKLDVTTFLFNHLTLYWLFGLLILGMIYSLGIQIVKYSTFKLEKKGNDLIASSGLMEKQQNIIPVNQVSALLISYSIFMKIFKLANLSAIRYVGSTRNKDNHFLSLLFPYFSAEQIPLIIKNQFNQDFEYNFKQELKKNKYYIFCLDFALVFFPLLASLFYHYFIIVEFLSLLILLKLLTTHIYVCNKNLVLKYGILKKNIILIKVSQFNRIRVLKTPISRIFNVSWLCIFFIKNPITRVWFIGFSDKDIQRIFLNSLAE